MDASKTVEVIERIKMIEVAEQEVARKKCELDSKVLKPAEAEKIKTQVLAQANHKKCVIEAEGVAAALEMKVKEITCLIGIGRSGINCILVDNSLIHELLIRMTCIS